MLQLPSERFGRIGIISVSHPLPCWTVLQTWLMCLIHSLPSLVKFQLKLGAKKARKFIDKHGPSIQSFTAPNAITQQDLDALSSLKELKLVEVRL